VIFWCLRGLPLGLFTGRETGSSAGVLAGSAEGSSPADSSPAGSTLIPSIWVVGVRYGLIEVERKLVLPRGKASIYDSWLILTSLYGPH
jgi:hypothetical protein